MQLSMRFVIAEKGLDFEHSCDQVTFRMPLSKKFTITVTEVVRIQVCLLTIGSKIIRINTRNAISSSLYSKVRSTKNKGVTFLFCLGHVGTLVRL